MPPRFGSSLLLALVLGLCAASPALPWGSEGHKLIVAKAVDVLPTEIRPFYQNHVQDLKRLSVEPDEVWKDPKQQDQHPEWKTRSNWHFLDIDHFQYKYPFKEFPRTRVGADSLYARADSLYSGRGNAGYLPWTIDDYCRAIVESWRNGDTEGVLRNSGHLSHFAGDATMPLHATRNYDGLISGNFKFKVRYGDPGFEDRSVHERFEIALVERNLARYGESVRISEVDCQRVPNFLASAFDVIVDSYFRLDRIIAADKSLMEDLGVLTDDKRAFDARRDDYYKAFDTQVGLLAVHRLRAGAVYLGNLWYSAWVEAGKPVPPVAK